MTRGFTLIEVIIYIALFSLLMGTAFVTAYGLIEGTNKLNAKTTVQEEGSFVMRKFNWALTSVSIFSIPNPNELTLTKYDGNVVNISLSANKIIIKESINGNTPLPITTDNVQVTNLQFQQVGSNPFGISATATINGTNFIITKYLRK